MEGQKCKGARCMILIDNRQNKIEVDDKLDNVVKDIVEYTLKEEKVNIDYEVSIIFVDNNEIRALNREFRNIDRETDVLSFPMLDYLEDKVYKETYRDYVFDASDLNEGRLVLGDMALSLEKAKEQSNDYGHSYLREVCYLTVHSILHLLGYDHMEEQEKLIMRNREEEILTAFNITRD